MRLLSVNVARPRGHSVPGKPPTTGIHKDPREESVYIGELGLMGDHIADVKNHGGPDQAVYLYSAEDYTWWEGELGRVLGPGTFGENLTLSSFGAGEVRVGDRYRVGAALLEVTSPRIPCATLAARMGDPQFVRRFREARRPGFYARVLEAGDVRSGDGVRRAVAGTDTPGILEMFELFFGPTPPAETLRRLLSAPIAQRARDDYAAQLQQREEPGVRRTP